MSCLTTLFTTGHFCSPGSTEPSPVSQTYGDVCPMGHFCPQGSGSPTPCPVGSFFPELGALSLSQCRPCPPGKYCLNPGASQPTGGELDQSWDCYKLFLNSLQLWKKMNKTHNISLFSFTSSTLSADSGVAQLPLVMSAEFLPITTFWGLISSCFRVFSNSSLC